MTTNRAGLYIHIPFCEKKCGYCDFYSIEPSDGVLEQYTTALANEIELLFNRYPNILFNTIYM
ncbi:MAG: coproporphyrinogen III oxidase, partial [Clostridia bacterium]